MIIKFLDEDDNEQVARIEADNLPIPRRRDDVRIKISPTVILVGQVEEIKWEYDFQTGDATIYVGLALFQRVEVGI